MRSLAVTGGESHGLRKNATISRDGARAFALEALEPRRMLTAQFDPSFGHDGQAAGTIAAPRGFLYVAAEVQPDQKIVVASTPYGLRTPPATRMSIQRFSRDGALDRGFGSSIVVDDPTPRFILPQRDGGVLVVADTTIYRFDRAGRLDTSFNLRYGQNELRGQYIFDAELLRDGRLLLLGAGASNVQLTFTRHLPNGEPDPTFGTGGTLVPISRLIVDAVFTIQPDGKVLILNSYGLQRMEMYRLDSSFNLDPTFGTGGRVAIGGQYGSGGIYIQRDGKIIVRLLDYSKTTLLRLSPSGRRDAGFGNNGRVDIPGSAGEVILHRHGKIVMSVLRGGEFDAAHRPETDILQLNYDGRPDASFARHGEFVLRDAGSGALAMKQGDKTIVLRDDKPRDIPVIHLFRVLDGPAAGNRYAAGLFAFGAPFTPLQVWSLKRIIDDAGGIDLL